MRAALLSEYHTPLELIERPDPEPTGARSVVVKIAGAGVCQTDLHTIDGHMEPAPCGHLATRERLARACDNGVRVRDHLQRVHGLTGGDAEPAPLARGEAPVAAVPAENRS